MKCLSELKQNQSALIKRINIENQTLKKHLLDMGLITGTKVKMKKSAPTGDPINIEIRGYELTLGMAILRKIEIEVIKNEDSINRKSK